MSLEPILVEIIKKKREREKKNNQLQRFDSSKS